MQKATIWKRHTPYDCLIGSHECLLLLTPSCCRAFIICSGLCACTEMLGICVLYVSLGPRVRPRTFWCIVMGSAVLFILRFRLLLYSAGCGVNRVQVVLSGFGERLFCFVQAKTLWRYGLCISWLHSCLCV